MNKARRRELLEREKKFNKKKTKKKETALCMQTGFHAKP